MLLMNKKTLYRNASWYEMLLGYFPLQLVFGLAVIALIPALTFWDWDFWKKPDDVQINTLIITTMAFSAIAITLRRILRYPGEQGSSYILPTILLIAGVAMASVLLLRLPYSNSFLTLSFILTVIWFSTAQFIVRSWRTLKLA